MITNVGKVLSDNVLFSRVPPPWFIEQALTVNDYGLQNPLPMNGLCLGDLPTLGPVYISIDVQINSPAAMPVLIVFCTGALGAYGAWDNATMYTTDSDRILWTKVLLSPGQAGAGASPTAYLVDLTAAGSAPNVSISGEIDPTGSTVIPLISPSNNSIILSFEAPSMLKNSIYDSLFCLATTDAGSQVITMSGADLSPARPSYHGAVARGVQNYS